MTISETIAALEKIKAEVGDVRVTRWSSQRGITNVEPESAHIHEALRDSYCLPCTAPKHRGECVVRM